MNLLTILSELNQIQAFIKEWESKGFIPEIEKEIALDKLKVLYAELKLAVAEPSVHLLEEVREPVASSISDRKLQGLFYEVNEPISAKADAAVAARQSGSREMPIADYLLEVANEDAVEKGLSVEEASPILMDISNLAGSINSNARPVEASFERKVVSKPATARQEMPVAPVHKVEVPKPAARMPFNHESKPREEVVTHIQSRSVAERTPQPERVLGEVIGSGKSSLNDSISGKIHQDLAAKLQQKPVSDLNKEISFNDKFLYIRELFNGDGKAYETAINNLNRCETLDEALIYISESYRWNANSAAAISLVDLLNRKFAN